MRHGMIKKTVLVAVALVLALVVSGCSSSSTTPTGNQCTSHALGCYYFVSNGSTVPCNVGITNYCKNTAGDFYEYVPSTGQTRLCESHVYGCVDSRAESAPKSCSPEYTYNNLVNEGQAWRVINKQADQNTTSGPVAIDLSSTTATTVSESASVELSVNADALLDVIFVSVHAQINASVSKTASTVVGNAVRVNIPAGMTANGIYGVRVQVTKGHLYQSNICGSAKADYGNVTTYVPLSTGWCVWLSGHTPCRVVPGN
jgi:hypothetical protein